MHACLKSSQNKTSTLACMTFVEKNKLKFLKISYSFNTDQALLLDLSPTKADACQ